MDTFSHAGPEGLVGDAIREMPAQRAGLKVSAQIKSPKHWVWAASDLKCADFFAHRVRPFQTVGWEEPHEIIDPEDPLVRLFRAPNPSDSRVEFRSQAILFFGASPGSRPSSRSCSVVNLTS